MRISIEGPELEGLTMKRLLIFGLECTTGDFYTINIWLLYEFLRLSHKLTVCCMCVVSHYEFLL